MLNTPRPPTQKPKSKSVSKSTPPIPLSFTTQKSTILASLSHPESTYTDSSPKGTLDAPIRELIDSINRLEGVVTTSSCSGRIAVFVEGRKSKSPTPNPNSNPRSASSSTASITPTPTPTPTPSRSIATPPLQNPTPQNPVPGGKGNEGFWIFVSHDPLPAPLELPSELSPLLPSPHSPPSKIDAQLLARPPSQQRLIHILFEPLILHLRCASLAHAKPLLALALDAGFRESGVQSLKCLGEGGNQNCNCNRNSSNNSSRRQADGAYPMLAIRSAGMGFGSVVGVFDDDDFHNDHDSVGRIRGLVSGEVLRFILRVANDRFVENGLRRERFAEGVRRLLVQRQDERFVRVGGGVDGDGDSAGSGWEDRDVRAARMRKEGLAIRDAARGDVDAADGVKGGARDYELGIDFADGLQIR